MKFQNTCALYWVEDVKLTKITNKLHTCSVCVDHGQACSENKCKIICLKYEGRSCFKTIITASNSKKSCNWTSPNKNLNWEISVYDAISYWKSSTIRLYIQKNDRTCIYPEETRIETITNIGLIFTVMIVGLLTYQKL